MRKGATLSIGQGRILYLSVQTVREPGHAQVVKCRSDPYDVLLRFSGYNSPMLSLILLMMAGPAEPTVTFAADAIQTKAFVEEIAKQTGQKLGCAPNVGTEPIVVQLDDAPLSELMPKLADLVGAEWVLKDGVKNLTRSAELSAKLEKADHEKAVAMWKAMLDAQLKAVNALPEFDKKEAERLFNLNSSEDSPEADHRKEIASLAVSNPLYRAGAAWLADMGPDAIERMQIGERMVFSDSPTKAQIQFSPSAMMTLATMRTQLDTLLEVAKNRDDRHIPYGGMPKFGYGSKLRNSYGKTLFAVERTRDHGIRFDVLVVDDHGEYIVNLEGAMPPDWSRGGLRPGLKGRKIELDERTMNLARVSSEAGVSSASGGITVLPNGKKIGVGMYLLQNENDEVPLDRGVGGILSDPTKHDPLGYVFGKLIRGVATDEKRQLLATAPDSALYLLSRAVVYKLIRTDADFLEQITESALPPNVRQPSCEIVRADNWLVVKPVLPTCAWKLRFNREAAKTFISTLRQKQYADLDDAILYVRANPGVPDLRSVDKIIISHASPQLCRASIEGTMRSPIEYLSIIGPAVWRGHVGKKTTFSQLSLPLQQQFSRWVYWTNELSQEANPWLAGDDERKFLREVTERLPNGIPPDALVTVERDQHLAFIARSKDGNVIDLSVYDYAQQSGESEGVMNNAYKRREYVSLREATQNNYTITLDLKNGFIFQRTIEETLAKPGAVALPPGQLSEATKNAIEEARKIVRGGGG